MKDWSQMSYLTPLLRAAIRLQSEGEGIRQKEMFRAIRNLILDSARILSQYHNFR